jgi:hypothetical protein
MIKVGRSTVFLIPIATVIGKNPDQDRRGGEIQGERRTRDSLGFSLLKRNHQRFITTTLYIDATAFLAWAGPTIYPAKPTQSQREIASHTLNRRW